MFANACSPIVSTLSGTAISVKAVPLKAAYPIVLTESEMVTSVILVLPLTNSSGITVTFDPILIEERFIEL